MGAHEQTITKQAIRAGHPIPERIANAPELRIGLMLYMQAFFDLDTERSHANGIMLIPWSKIQEYAVLNRMSEEQTYDLHFHIRAMDAEHTKRLAAKMKAAMQR